MSFESTARASILPAGSIPPVSSLVDGEIKIKILKIISDGGKRFYLTCEYPNGFIKEHQAGDAVELAPKLVNNLRAVFGIESAAVKIPFAFKEGAIIVMEVKNAA